MDIQQNSENKKYNLESRTFLFALNTRNFLKNTPKSISNFEYGKQLIRSSASVGANYIEASESLGRKDFFMHIKIARKEAKESRYWFSLIDTTSSKYDLDKERNTLIQESTELLKIFSSITQKSM